VTSAGAGAVAYIDGVMVRTGRLGALGGLKGLLIGAAIGGLAGGLCLLLLNAEEES
jgi:hypothetical protein